MRKSKVSKDGQPLFDTSNSNLMKTLNKHIQDWFVNHPEEEFMSPMVFQQSYPLFDKYETKTFQYAFYAVKRKIHIGEYLFFFI